MDTTASVDESGHIRLPHNPPLAWRNPEISRVKAVTQTVRSWARGGGRSPLPNRYPWRCVCTGTADDDNDGGRTGGMPASAARQQGTGL